MIPIPTSDVRTPRRPCRGDNMPCIICGQPVKPTGCWWVHVHKGGSHAVTEAEAAALNAAGEEGGDMYFLRVGPDCLRRNPALQPYAVKSDALSNLTGAKP